MVLDIFIWGFVIGIIHFIIVGILYQNPIVANIYKKYKDHPGLKKWENTKKYLLFMFLGTQIEAYILASGYIILRTFFNDPDSFVTALILSIIFCLIRVYPRFWNMWIQSNYPIKLLFIELLNGTIGTFIIILGLYFLPI